MSSEAAAPPSRDGSRQARTPLGVRQARHRRDLRARLSKLASNSSPRRHARLAREAGLPVRAVDDLTGFPEMMDGRLKDAPSPSSTAASSASATTLTTSPPPKSTASSGSTSSASTSTVRATAARPRPPRRLRHRADRHRRPTMIRPPRRTTRTSPSSSRPRATTAFLGELEPRTARSAGRRAAPSPARPSTPPPATTPPSPAGSASRPAPSPGPLRSRVREDDGAARTARTRPSAPPTTRRSATARTRSHGAAAQGKQLSYNTCSTSTRPPPRRRTDRPGLRDRQAQHPCGAALGEGGYDAYERAFSCDPPLRLRWHRRHQPRSRRSDRQADHHALHRSRHRPHIQPAALEVLASKPNLRVLEDRERRFRRGIDPEYPRPRRRHAHAGPRHRPGRPLPVRSRHRPPPLRIRVGKSPLRLARVRPPRQEQTPSSSPRDRTTVGIGAGQKSRVDSVRLASTSRASTPSTAPSSPPNAFSRLPTVPKLAIDSGVRAIIQPGGSVRDDEVIEAANKRALRWSSRIGRHFGTKRAGGVVGSA